MTSYTKQNALKLFRTQVIYQIQQIINVSNKHSCNLDIIIFVFEVVQEHKLASKINIKIFKYRESTTDSCGCCGFIVSIYLGEW